MEKEIQSELITKGSKEPESRISGDIIWHYMNTPREIRYEYLKKYQPHPPFNTNTLLPSSF